MEYARAGYALYNTPTGRKVARSVSDYLLTPRRSRTSKKFTPGSASKRPKPHFAGDKPRGQAPYQQFCGKPLKITKAKKKCKVSKSFKKKVLCAVEAEIPTGKYTGHSAGVLYRANDGFQSASPDIQNASGQTITAAEGAPVFDFFTAQQVLDQASQLFNGKAYSQNYQAVTNNFSMRGLVVDVLYQKAVLQFRNNTQTTKTIDFYECISKHSTDITAYTCWTNCIQQDHDEGTGLNTSLLAATYGATPGMTEKFGTQWNYNVRSISLNPGQMSSLVVKGPKMSYLFDKYDNDTVATADTKYIYPKGVGYSCFYILKELEVKVGIPTSAITPSGDQQDVGHLSSVASYPQYSVTVEVKYQSAIAAPEQTTVALRKQVYMYHHDFTGDSNASISRIDVRTPVVPENTPTQHGTGSGTLG